MMKIYVVNGKLYMNEHTGIHRYAYNVVREIDKQLNQYCDMQVDIVLPEEARSLKLEIKEIELKSIRIIYYKSCPFGSLTLWQNFCFPAYVKKVKGIALCIGNIFPPLYCKGIVVVHDIMKITHPKWHGFGVEKIKNLANHRTHFSSKGGYITVSRHTHDEIIRYYHNRSRLPFLGIVGCGWDHIEAVMEDENIFVKYPSIVKGQYFFTLGGAGFNRNFSWIYNVAEKFPNITFVIAGKNEDERGLSNVIHTGLLSDGEIKALYKKCRSYIYPSLDEGFGITPLEALGCGVPIIISDIEVFREIYKNTAHYVDPYDTEINIEQLLLEPVDNPSEILAKFTWKNAAFEFLNILDAYKQV